MKMMLRAAAKRKWIWAAGQKMEGQKVTSRKYYEMELQKLNASLLEMGEMIRMAIGAGR